MAVPANLFSLFLFAIIACLAFRSMGLIIASVVNSSQESLILIQPLYMAMLFLSGATFPISFFPEWLQIVTQFIPATYLMTGTAGILQQGESILQNWLSVVALLVTTADRAPLSPRNYSAGRKRRSCAIAPSFGCWLPWPRFFSLALTSPGVARTFRKRRSWRAI